MKHKDFDGYLTLILSIFLIIFSLGITYLLVFIYGLVTAIKTGYNHSSARHIVIPGKKLVNNLPDTDYRNRLDRAVAIFGHSENKQIYILGGITGKASVSESRAGKNYLVAHRVPADLIQIEENSRDTLENMKQLKTNSVLNERNIVLITNRYHLARACLIAKGFGFVVKPCAAENRYIPGIIATLKQLADAFHLHWFLTGRTYARLMQHQRMLSRIQ